MKDNVTVPRWFIWTAGAAIGYVLADVIKAVLL